MPEFEEVHTAGLVSTLNPCGFAIVGVPITLGLRSLIDVVPWAAIAIGLAIAGLGAWMLLGHELRVRLPGLERAGDDRSLGSSFLFGISYAVASLSGTLPVFLTVVAGGILVVAGIYIVWFWATNLQDPLTASGPVALVDLFSSRATEFVGDRPGSPLASPR